ncbi:hypothetical protein Zm00014a_036415 [Zea mays]|nr:hypothetical protein Zm00014a_036415 [Zea mays]
MPLICFFPPAATLFPCEQHEARMAMSKHNILLTVVDDLFDVEGSREEMENLVKLVEMWDAHNRVGFCSERVEIVFRAIYDTSNHLAAKAAAVQKRSIIHHLAELWANTVRAMMAEANWAMTGHLPTFEEYMAAGEPSFGLGPIVLASLYLVGPELPEDVVTSQEYNEMFRHMNVCGRLLNDLQSYEREKEQGKVNSVLLLLALEEEGGSIEAVKREVRRAIEASRIQLLRLVLRNESEVPWPCRQVFWNICKVVHQFYVHVDGYASAKQMMHAGNAVVHHPLQIPRSPAHI